MPPTKQGDAGGSQSGARARRKHTAVSRPAPTMTTRSRAAEQSLSPQRATERSREDEKSAKRRKRTKVGNQEVAAAATAGSDEDAASGSAGIQEVAAAASAGGHEDAVAASEGIQEDAVAASVPAAAGHVSNTASQSQEDAAASTSAAVLSSTLSSPLRCPFIPEVIKSQDSKRVVYEPFDQAAVKAYLKENKKYTAKLGRHNELLTLNDTCPKTCLDVQKMLPVRESATDTVFQAADSVLGLSSYIDGNLLAQCSGFLINWDKDTKHGTVLTSASLICTKSPRVDLWSCAREYAPEAQVLVHLLDETVVKGNLLHYHRHYNIALFEVVVNMPTKLPLCTKLDYGQEVYLVGRDENMNLNTSHGRVACEDPGLYDHHHFMYVNCGISKFSAGGPAINTDGGVVGMVDPTPRTAFVPTSVILKCVRLWKDFKCVPRLHLGLKLSSIMCLRSSHREKIRRMLKFDAGLIVQEVSEGSAAEKVGIRIGDGIKSLNEECLSTTIELEAMLLRICEDHLDKGSGIGSNVDFTVELLVGIVVGGIVGSVLKKISNSNAKDTQTAGIEDIQCQFRIPGFNMDIQTGT